MRTGKKMFGVWVLLALISSADADTITKRVGSEERGILVAVEDTVLVFSTDDGKTFRIFRSQVESIRFPELVSLSTGRVIGLDRTGRMDLATFGATYGAGNATLLAVVFGVEGSPVIPVTIAGAVGGFLVPWTGAKGDRSVMRARK